MTDVCRYGLRSVDRLLEGEIWDGLRWREVWGSYMQLRSRMEHLGLLDEDGVSEVLDLDRAIEALRRASPVAAVLVTLLRDGWGLEDVEDVFRRTGLRTDPGKLVDKATCFLAAYMNGASMHQALDAYRKGRMPVRWERDLG